MLVARLVTRDGTDVTDENFTGLKRLLLSLGVDKNAVNNCGSRGHLKALGLLHQVLLHQVLAAEPNRVVDPAQLQMAAQMMNQQWTVSNTADDTSTDSQLRTLDAEIAAQSALNNSRQVLPSLREPQGHPWGAALGEILEPASAASTPHQLLFDFTPVRNQEVQTPAEVNRSGDTTLVRTYTAGGTDRSDEAAKYLWYVLCCCQSKRNQAAAG